MFVNLQDFRKSSAAVLVLFTESETESIVTAAANCGVQPAQFVSQAIAKAAIAYGAGSAILGDMGAKIAGYQPVFEATAGRGPAPVPVPQAKLFEHAPPAPGVFFGRNRYNLPRVERPSVPNDGERCYSVGEAAAACGLGESTIGREISHGNLPVYRPTPRRILIPAHSLDQFRRDVLPKIQPRPDRQRPIRARQG